VDTTKELPTVIAFCAGYGGIERGLDLAGIEHRVVAYVEIEAFAIANLVAKMETGQLDPAPIYTDIKTFPSHLFRGKVSILTAGYPCQPFSAAGKRRGADDPRHLWPYIRRHIESIRPVQCFFENVEGHISLGLSTVVSDLEEDGYTTTWGIFSAREVGAPHQRKRVYIMANSRCSASAKSEQQAELWATGASESPRGAWQDGGQRANEERQVWPARAGEEQYEWEQPRVVWKAESRMGRTVDGCPNRVDRIRLLGNAVVPQTAARAYTTLMRRYQ
jgi:DNA (cytosine-5)-methyltransferase 1